MSSYLYGEVISIPVHHLSNVNGYQRHLGSQSTLNLSCEFHTYPNQLNVINASREADVEIFEEK
jgi:hypothetical protein